MSIKVAKFGGTSLADANQMLKVRDIVLSDESRRYVVPSAPGKRNVKDQKITDLLYLCHEHVKQGVAFDYLFTLIGERYREIVRELGLNLDMTPHLEEVEKTIAAGASAEYCASRGEALNGPILAELLGFDFVDAAEVICFNAKGRFDTDTTREKMRDRLLKHERAVVPGFYGAMPDGEIKTFSRGGSDITGALVARGVKAEVYENWTDVSGLLMADPRIIKNPANIKTVTYRELRELSYMGASVLHDEAIFPVREAGIPVNIRNTNEPDHPGTMIIPTDDAPAPTGTITGIAGKKDFTIIFIEKALMNAEVGFGRRALSVLESQGVSFEHLPSGIDTMSIVVENSQLENKLDDVLEELQKELKTDSIAVTEDVALIATVGRGMSHTPGMAAKLFGALATAGVNIRMIDQGSSEMNIIVGVAIKDFETALRAIYDAFVVEGWG